MDGRNDLLADLSRDAAMERTAFLADAGQQLERFLHEHAERIRDLGGLTLIDEDPDYLAIAPDGTFRSRSRVLDTATGDWQSDSEIVETGGELVELYNPADIFAAFADAARGAVWADAGDAPNGEAGGSRPTMSIHGPDPYTGAADRWAAGQPEVPEVRDRDEAAAALYDLALDFQERSQRAEAGLLEAFEMAAYTLTERLDTFVIADDLDEHLELVTSGFRGRVVTEGETGWTDLDTPDQIVRYYDPTDVFGDLADAIAEAFPAVAADEDVDDGGDGPA